MKKRIIKRVKLKPKPNQKPKHAPILPPPVLAPPPQRRVWVATVIPDCHDPWYQKWFDLQIRYLHATLPDFHHISVVHQHTVTPFFADNTDVIHIGMDVPAVKPYGSHFHMYALNTLAKYLAKKFDKFEYCLFLDIDAFPIRTDWLAVLEKAMGTRYKIATLLRSEVMECRLHSSVLLAKATVVGQLRWELVDGCKNLFNNPERDVQLISHQHEPGRDQVYVMVRSNQYNMHPGLCGVYYDLFYHHARSGSGVRVATYNPYWWHNNTANFDVVTAAEQLFADPNTFIAKLAGWSPSLYAKV